MKKKRIGSQNQVAFFDFVQLIRYPAREPVFYFLNFGVFEKDLA